MPEITSTKSNTDTTEFSISLTDMTIDEAFREKGIVLSAKGARSFKQFHEAQFLSTVTLSKDGCVTILNERQQIIARYWPSKINPIRGSKYDQIDWSEYTCTAHYAGLIKAEASPKSMKVHSLITRGGVDYEGLTDGSATWAIDTFVSVA